MTVTLVLAALALAGLVLTSLQVVLVHRARRRPFPAAAGGAHASRPAASTPPSTPFRVSVLKPLSGLDDELEENLASFARLTGVAYEVILSVEREDDPATAVARRVMARFPEAPFLLVVGGGTRQALKNGKVDRLAAAARRASGEILLVSDANVRVEPDDVARTVSHFDDPAVGCVSNLFVADGAATLGAAVESLHLLTFVVPGTALAAAGGVPCVVGKSMALSRRALEAVGGFGRFLDVLAEDQAIGLAVKAAGYRVVLSPAVVRNVVVERTLRRALERQVRWGKIRFAFSPATYTSELLLNPFALSLLAAVSAAASGELLGGAAALAAAAALARVVQARVLARLTGSRLPARQVPLVLLKDVLQLATYTVPYVSRTVSWHGLAARVGPGTVLLPVGRRVPPLPAWAPPALPSAAAGVA